MSSDDSNDRKRPVGIMNVAGTIDNGKEKSGLCNMECQRKIGIGFPFDGIIAIRCPSGTTLCA
jgi:hypothetical protein